MKFLKYLFVSIFVLITVVVIAAVVVLPQIDFTKYKGQIEAKASEVMGTEVKIAKLGTLKILPKPTVEAEGIMVASHIGGAPLLSADRLAIRLSISELLAMKIGVDLIEVIRPRVSLVNTARGSSWAGAEVFSDGNGHGEEEDHKKGGGDNPMEKLTSLGKISIVDGSFVYNDSVTGVKHTVEDLNINLGAGDLSKTQIDTSVRYNAVPIKITGSLDLRKLKNIPMNIQVDLNGNKLHALGRVRYLMEEPSFTGTLKAEAPTLMGTLNTMLGLELTDMPFELDGDILASAQVFKTSQFVVKANNTSSHIVADITDRGSSMVTGTVTVSVPEFDGMNWGACGAEVAESSQPAKGASVSAKKSERFSKEAIDFSALKNFDVALNMSVDNVVCGAASIEDVNAKLVLRRGLMELKPFSFKAGDEGSFVTNFVLDTTGNVPTGTLKTALNVLNLADVVESKVKADIPLEGLIDLQFSGVSAFDMVNSLSGSANINATDGQISGVPLGKLKLGLETFSGLALGGGENYQLEELAMPFTVNGGVFHTEAALLKLSKQTMVAKGKIDLPKWRINMDITPKIGTGEATLMTLPLKLSGPLDSPSIKPDLNSAQGIGAAIGTAIGGPLGTGLGAAAGSIISGQGSSEQKKEVQKKLNDTADKVKEELNKKLDKAVPTELKGLLGF
jgi:uncharacterized protein involved in outer membrane biogenesis